MIDEFSSAGAPSQQDDQPPNVVSLAVVPPHVEALRRKVLVVVLGLMCLALLGIIGVGMTGVLWLGTIRCGWIDVSLQRSTCLGVLAGHTDRLTSVRFSPDGSLLASASRDTTIRLWRPSDGTLVRVLRSHTDNVYAVAFSPDGKMVASGSLDQTVRLWRVADGQPLHVLRAIPTGSTPSPFPRMARSSPPVRVTAPRGCGVRLTAPKCAPSWATPALCSASPFRLTAQPS